MRKLFFVVLVLGAPVFCFAQGEGNIWHFGFGGGIDFNSGSAVAITGPLISGGEGSSVMCDSSGNLLFSTDGITVYNSTGAIMATGLNGHISSTQAALIVPYPGNSSKYFIFTSGYGLYNNGICYSVVDINLNGGLGGLVSINTQLVHPACEKLIGIRNCNGNDYWVIVHSRPSNEYYSYPITSFGVGNPVITSIGSNIPNNYATMGYLKFSNDGKKLVAANQQGSSVGLEMFDFNSGSGILSNYVPILGAGSSYGICFSPDDSKLYVSYSSSNASVKIRQYDLTTPNFQSFPYTVMSGSNIAYGAIQLAPNGKIYCARNDQSKLGVINYPNFSGTACSYSNLGFTLDSGTTSGYGLPNFINNNFTPLTLNLGLDILACSNSPINTIDAGFGFSNYLWNTGDTTSVILVTNSGSYSVTVSEGPDCSASDSINVIIAPSPTYSINSFTDTLYCATGLSGAVDISVINGSGSYTYQWSNGATTQDLTNLNAGTYTVTVTDSVGCSVSNPAITIVQVNDLSVTDNFTDTLNCANALSGVVDISVINGSGSYTYQWSNGATTQDLNNLNAGTYTVTVTDSIGCIVSDPPITIVQINDLQVNNTSFNNLKCHDDTNGFINVTVSNGLSPNNYAWSNGATTEDLNNLTAGTCSVTVSDAGGCTASDTVVITAPNQVIALLTTAADTVFCSVTGGSPSYHYLWSTGATTAFITSATNGTYSVTVSDINNCTSLASITIESVSTIDGDNDFEIYPNPANGQLIIDNGQWIINEIQITDVLGRLVQSFEFKVQSPATINVSDFAEGIYFIKLVSSSGITLVRKFVVVH